MEIQIKEPLGDEIHESKRDRRYEGRVTKIRGTSSEDTRDE